MKILYKFFKKATYAGEEAVLIYDNKEIDYYTFLFFPDLEDSISELKEELKKRGWNTHEMMDSLLYKKKIPFTEIIDCLIFNRSVRKTYDFLTEGYNHLKVPLKTNQFLQLVEFKSNTEKGRGLKFPKKMIWENLTQFLLRLEFRPASDYLIENKILEIIK